MSDHAAHHHDHHHGEGAEPEGGFPIALVAGLVVAVVLLIVVLVQRAATGHGHATHDPHAEKSALDHVLDGDDWHLFESFEPKHFDIPGPITKFMVLQAIAALLVFLVYTWVARRMADGGAPRGGLLNAFECLLTFVRNDVARPNLGDHDGDKYTPFLWTLFLYILFNNLLGMFPLFGSATSSIYMTLGLAICVFFAIHGAAVSKMGFGHYVHSMWPQIDVPFPMDLIIKPVVFVIEVIGVLVRNVVLAVRLFANMFAGHMVLGTILIFIFTAGHAAMALWVTVTVSSVLGMVALSLLELFVAFLQAFIFTFLTSLFMGMALHPQH